MAGDAHDRIAGESLGDEEVESHGRGALAHLDHEDQIDAEPDGIESDGGNHGKGDGQGHHNDGKSIQQAAEHNYAVSDIQLTHFKFGILENSLILFVIIVRPRLKAWAAINVSKGPIDFPLDSRSILIFPYRSTNFLP